MLNDLLAVSGYFDDLQASFYEEDLAQRYGRDAVDRALDQGWLLHGWIPCGRGRRRCVVRLSERGARAANKG